MIRFSKLKFHFFFVAMMLLASVQPAEGTTMSFNVHPGEEMDKSVNLAVDDRVLIHFTVVGRANSSLYFYITCPNGTVKDFGKAGTFNYSFVCDAAGEYVLHFSNRESSEDKFVVLEYEVQHYIFGIPQMLFMTIIIVCICVAAVAAFVLMGRTR